MSLNIKIMRFKSLCIVSKSSELCKMMIKKMNRNKLYNKNIQVIIFVFQTHLFILFVQFGGETFAAVELSCIENNLKSRKKNFWNHSERITMNLKIQRVKMAFILQKKNRFSVCVCALRLGQIDC